MSNRKTINIGRVKGSMVYSGTDFQVEKPLENDLYLHSEEYAFYQYKNGSWQKIADLEEHSLETEGIKIGTSEDFDIDSDTEIPTTKAVKKYVNDLINKLDLNEPIIKITHYELEVLKFNRGLKIGQKYLITDYGVSGTYTNEDGLEALAPAYPCGYGWASILVTAISVNKFSEEALYICYGDAYNCRYAFDSDVNRFAWANISPRGVVYWLKDKYNNEFPYDFYQITVYGSEPAFDLDEETVSSIVQLYNYANKTPSGDGLFLGCRDNIIKPRKISETGAYDLPFIRFIEKPAEEWGPETELPEDKYGFYGIVGNVFGENCYNITLNSSCSYNTFGDNCENITLGHFSHSNTFGNYFRNNTIGNECQSNFFGAHCQNNIILNRFRCNFAEGELSDGQFGNDIKYNHFGLRSNTLDLWDGCQYNRFGNFNQRILLHGECLSNDFNNGCYDITLNGNCNGNIFYPDVNNLTITDTKHTVKTFNT